MLAAAEALLRTDVGQTGSGGLCRVVRVRRLCVLSLLQRLLLEGRRRAAGHDQVQMFQVWLQLPQGAGRLQIPSLVEGDPGQMHIRSHSIRNLPEPILWHSRKWTTEDGGE